MNYDEDEETEAGFKMSVDDDEIGEPLDMPELPEDDDDPENKFH